MVKLSATTMGAWALVLWGLALVGACQAQNRPFDHWAAAIVSADWRDPDGQPIMAFDNARRDLSDGFVRAGFSRDTLVQASLRPDVAKPTTADDLIKAFSAVTARADKGCLVYLTSHGAPDHIVFGPGELAPDDLAMILRQTCGTRPTVLVVSACYSGIFVDGLIAANRMIVTAARRDRTSFGCGIEDDYTFFDGCMVQSLKTATDFIALAQAARACVAQKEAAIPGIRPSEPQIFIGADMQLRLPTLRFNPPDDGERPGS